MIVTEVETLRLEEFPNVLWVLVHTDEGLTGLGETFFGARAAETYIHQTAAPSLLGKEALHIDRHARELYGYHKELVTKVPEVSDGHVSPPEGPGLGTELLPGLGERPDAHLVISTLEV